jgi:hypothetical protein
MGRKARGHAISIRKLFLPTHRVSTYKNQNRNRRYPGAPTLQESKISSHLSHL